MTVGLDYKIPRLICQNLSILKLNILDFENIELTKFQFSWVISYLEG